MAAKDRFIFKFIRQVMIPPPLEIHKIIKIYVWTESVLWGVQNFHFQMELEVKLQAVKSKKWRIKSTHIYLSVCLPVCLSKFCLYSN